MIGETSMDWWMASVQESLDEAERRHDLALFVAAGRELDRMRAWRLRLLCEALA